MATLRDDSWFAFLHEGCVKVFYVAFPETMPRRFPDVVDADVLTTAI